MKPDPRIAITVVTEEGDKAEVIPCSIKPLTYEDIITENTRYPMQMSAKEGSVKINGEVLEKDRKIDFKIQFNEEITIYVLELGGWLPFSFANYKNMLPDRNVISSIKQIKSNKLRDNTKATDWWLKSYKESDLTINPLLYAFEGQYQRFPNYIEFCKSFNEASAELKEYFPKAKIIGYPSEEIYQKVYQLLIEVSEQNISEQEFLLCAAPLVANRVSDKELNDTQNAIDDLAEKYGILGESLLYYLIVSCLYDPKDGSGYLPARRIVKPKENYTKEMAYNAIADVNAITFFIQSLSLPKLMMPVCTCDKPLAAFWAAINPFERTVQNRKINVEFQLTKHLFPRLNPKEIENFASTLNKKKLLSSSSKGRAKDARP
ncbi:MAG: hypothetical protein OEL83_00780 [Desulforhopalus sp.]|nr:hypothetical protein [Desulforhopalus sp.]